MSKGRLDINHYISNTFRFYPSEGSKSYVVEFKLGNDDLATLSLEVKDNGTSVEGANSSNFANIYRMLEGTPLEHNADFQAWVIHNKDVIAARNKYSGETKR